MNRRKTKQNWLSLKPVIGPYMIITVILLIADQLTKFLAYTFLRSKVEVSVIPRILYLTYVQNIGAAFGIFRNKQWIFILFALVIMAFVVWVFPRLCTSDRFIPLRFLGSLLFSGAAGNMIDRILHNYVIDFIYFKIIQFPVFNLADIFVCVSCICFLLLMFFYYKEEEIDLLTRSKKKEAYIQELIRTVQKEHEHHND